MKMICIEAFVFFYSVNDPVGLRGRGENTVGIEGLRFYGTYKITVKIKHSITPNQKPDLTYLIHAGNVKVTFN